MIAEFWGADMTFERKQPNVQTFPLKNTYCCWICRNPVDMRTCKTDEHGMAVHGDCYFLKLWLLRRGAEISTPPPNRLPASSHHGPRSWRAFLGL
jgi:hypothetical protein